MTGITRRPANVGRFTAEELALAARNSGMPLEALREEVTPAGLHYCLIHFDIPALAPPAWRLVVDGLVQRPQQLSLEALRAMPARTVRVTMECAGNGRAQVSPRYPSIPWVEEAVSTADWTGVPLAAVLREAGLRPGAREVVFWGADRGIDRGVEHAFARSLAPADAAHEDVLLAYAMNGAPLPPQHGYPLRLVVPRWYGMAGVKWLERIEATERAFDGVQQAHSYHFRREAGEQGVPCRYMRVNSLLVPPGIPDFYTRARVQTAGRVEIRGRAWSGEADIAHVEFAVDGAWRAATLHPTSSPYAWRAWHAVWDAAPGEHELACRATDAAGHVQPLEPPWDVSGFGNNAVHRVAVRVV
ncbi:MAG: sulfite oxidase [Betaproteobacteria bacterium]|nr:sulfite oxidase [Betaproteobacteria bacterium]